jgi:hypothetical protein
MIEVLDMLEKFTIPLISILGIIFIFPFQEVESSGFHIESSKSAYFTRYFIESIGTLQLSFNIILFQVILSLHILFIYPSWPKFKNGYALR